jgi:hypothetical protein
MEHASTTISSGYTTSIMTSHQFEKKYHGRDMTPRNESTTEKCMNVYISPPMTVVLAKCWRRDLGEDPLSLEPSPRYCNVCIQLLLLQLPEKGTYLPAVFLLLLHKSSKREKPAKLVEGQKWGGDTVSHGSNTLLVVWKNGWVQMVHGSTSHA